MRRQPLLVLRLFLFAVCCVICPVVFEAAHGLPLCSLCFTPERSADGVAGCDCHHIPRLAHASERSASVPTMTKTMMSLIAVILSLYPLVPTVRAYFDGHGPAIGGAPHFTPVTQVPVCIQAQRCAAMGAAFDGRRLRFDCHALFAFGA